MAKSEKNTWLDSESKVGEKVQWYTMTKEVKQGTLIRMDSRYMATLRLEDGTEIQYQC